MTNIFDIIIVGGGMAGLALAASLHKMSSSAPLRIALIEANEPNGVRKTSSSAEANQSDGLSNDVLAYDSRVSALTNASIGLLRKLGVWESITQGRHCPFDAMHVWDAQGLASIDFSAEEVGQAYLGAVVENRLTTQALWRSVLGAANVSLLCPRKVVDLRCLEHDGERLQEVELDSGECLSASLVVAADGGNSKIRQMAGFETREWSYGQRAIVATVKVSKSHENTAWQRFLPEGPLAFLPLASDCVGAVGKNDEETLCSIVWSLDTELAEIIIGYDDSDFKRKLGEAIEHVLGDVLEVSPRFSFPLRQKHAVNYVKPGLVLIGDAAHVVHPLAGQGVNLGLQDVGVLAEELQRAVTRELNLGDESVLRRYQRRRKADNLAMMATVEVFKRLFGSRALPVVWLRNEGVRRLNGLSVVKRRIVKRAMGF